MKISLICLTIGIVLSAINNFEVAINHDIIRINSAIEKIMKDTIKVKLLSPYYGEFNDCIKFRDSSDFISITRRKMGELFDDSTFKRKYYSEKKHDSIEEIRFNSFKRQKFLLKPINDCNSIYSLLYSKYNDSVYFFCVGADTTRPGLMRVVYYYYIFNQKDRITKSVTSFVLE